MDPAGLDALRVVLAKLRTLAAAGRSRDYYRANLRFHDIIVQAAGSAHIADAYDGVTKRLAIHRIGSQASEADMSASLAEHEVIVGALAAHDPTAAGRALADHCRSGYHRHLGRSTPA
jgi:DNA-binding GntR family transcriptional regulator